MRAKLDMKARVPVLRSCAYAGLLAFVVLCSAAVPATALDYREDFDAPGRPAAPPDIVWRRKTQLSSVSDWRKLIPGDGFAYLSVEKDRLRKDPLKPSFWPFKKLWIKPEWPFISVHPFLPFQTLAFGPVGPNHRISMRAANAAIPGVACFLFTYREKRTFDEIDIEIVPGDTQGTDPGHRTGPGGGWTDVRLNTWAKANRRSLLPMCVNKQPIRDGRGMRVSHRDGRFHVYSIEWRPQSVRIYIDDVLQKVIDSLVPQSPATVIFGMRQAPWSGGPPWSGMQTMQVDWVSIEPLNPESESRADG